MISANKDGQTFSKSMEVLKNEAHGMSTMVGSKVLWTVANAGCIISNEYAVQAELSIKLAKQVGPYSFTPMTAAASCTHLNCNPNHLLLGNLFSNKVKDKLFPDADFSSTTMFMALRGANQVTELYPKEFEQGCCQQTQKNDEYDMVDPYQIICIPSKRNADGSIDIIMSNREGKVFQHTEADDRIAWEATSHSMLGDQLFPWEELPRNCNRIDVLEWYIEIANEMNLSLVNITLFPMVADHGSLTVHTSVRNMWSSYIDRLKAEANKGNKKKWVNPISVRCLSIIHCLITNY
jgi:hypothetical protein